MESMKMKILGSQAKKIIHNVLQYFQKEKELGHPITSLEKVHKRVADACGITERKIQAIAREGRDSIRKNGSPSFASPYKQRKPRSKTVTEFDGFQKDVLRRTVMEFYDEGKFPKLNTIRERIQEKINFHGSASSVWRVLQETGFKYKRSVDGRKFLMERNDVVSARIAFLRKMKNLRSAGERTVFYLDETWINQNHSLGAAWIGPNGEGGLKVPIGKGGRLIICHVGSAKTGFLEECELVFRSKGKKSDDYHSEMNAAVFTKWFEKFLETVKARGITNSIIVMDNASYHSVLIEKPPSTSTRKGEIQNWLLAKEIPYTCDQTKAELLALVRLSKPIKTYDLDRKAAAEGHTVVRLPPYHCQYNPIELVWSQVKREVAEKNATFKMSDLEVLARQALKNVTAEFWAACTRHAEELQDSDFSKEIARDEALEPIIIQLRESDSEDDDEGEEDDDEVLAMPL